MQLTAVWSNTSETVIEIYRPTTSIHNAAERTAIGSWTETASSARKTRAVELCSGWTCLSKEAIQNIYLCTLFHDFEPWPHYQRGCAKVGDAHIDSHSTPGFAPPLKKDSRRGCDLPRFVNQSGREMFLMQRLWRKEKRSALMWAFRIELRVDTSQRLVGHRFAPARKVFVLCFMEAFDTMSASRGSIGLLLCSLVILSSVGLPVTGQTAI